jgi:hypothetical protein
MSDLAAHPCGSMDAEWRCPWSHGVCTSQSPATSGSDYSSYLGATGARGEAPVWQVRHYCGLIGRDGCRPAHGARGRARRLNEKRADRCLYRSALATIAMHLGGSHDMATRTLPSEARAAAPGVMPWAAAFRECPGPS